MFSCYQNTKNEVISSRLWDIYLIKDVWRDWDDGRIGMVYARVSFLATQSISKIIFRTLDCWIILATDTRVLFHIEFSAQFQGHQGLTKKGKVDIDGAKSAQISIL